jgi:ParB family chromosome partitioning protein
MATATKKPAVKKTAKKSEVPAAEVAPVVTPEPETIPEVTTEIHTPVIEAVIDPAPESPADIPAESVSGAIIEIAIDNVFPDPDQPRKTFDRAKLIELGNSIKHEGQLMPVRVSIDPIESGKYILEDGERRYHACRLANITTIQAVIVPAASDSERLVRQMSANTGEPLLPMETANGYHRLSDSGWSLDKIARSFGVSQETVKLDLMLCNCAKPIQDAVDRGFSKSVARRLSTITDMSRQMGAYERAAKCPNSKKAMASIEAYLAQVAQTTIFTELKETTDGDKTMARKAWGSLKSGFFAFKNTPFSNGQGLVLIGAMKSQAHRVELEATAKEMIKAAQKILDDLNTYQAAIEQNKAA